MLALQLQLQQVSTAPPKSALLTITEQEDYPKSCGLTLCVKVPVSSPAGVYVERMSVHCI